MQWDPKAGRASTSLHRSGALEAEWGAGRGRRGRRLAGAGPFSTFTEHPLGPGLSFRGDRDQTALLPWSSPWGGGSVPVGITEEGLP